MINKGLISQLHDSKYGSIRCDDILSEYYVDILASVLQKAYRELFEKGQLPPAFNEALISLIPIKERQGQHRPIKLQASSFIKC